MNEEPYKYVFRDVYHWCEDNLEGSTLEGQVRQMHEELDELSEAKNNDKPVEKIELEAGDVGIVWVAICHALGLNPLTAMSKAYDKIKHRDGKMVNGQFVKAEDLEEKE